MAAEKVVEAVVDEIRTAGLVQIEVRRRPQAYPEERA